MKNFRSFSSVLLIMIIMSTAAHAQDRDQGGKLLRHVVLFKFKDTAKPTDVKTIEDAFADLPKKISLIKEFEWGIHNGSGDLNQGLTHCFLVSFSSEEDLDTYMVHPDHKAFVQILGPHLDKITVVDYWTK